MKRSLLLFAVAFVVQLGALHAQRENKWAFGINAGIDFNNPNPAAIHTGITHSDPGNLEGVSSVCDSSGQFLFYTEGSYVWDKNGNLMPNGSDITNNGFTTDADNPTFGTSQGSLIVPMPDSANKYYIFSLASYDQMLGSIGRLYYSVVDMSLNSGLGDVIPGRKGIPLDTTSIAAEGLTEHMTAAIGSNCSIWVLVCSAKPAFKAYEITAAGINTTPVVSNVGIGGDPSLLASVGTMCVSPDGKKIAASAFDLLMADSATLAVYDFDPATGLVSNPVKLITSTDTDYLAHATCFSPDGSKLYTNIFLGGDHNYIYQFDLSSGNAATMRNSRIPVGTASYGQIKLAPDGKVYFFTDTASSPGFGTATYMGRFDAPNLAGTASQYVAKAIPLQTGTLSAYGLPNVVKEVRTLQPLAINVNGFVLGTTHQYDSYQWYKNGQPIQGATSASYTVTENGVYSVMVSNGICQDSVSKAINNVSVPYIVQQNMKLNIYPNPANSHVTVAIDGPGAKEGTIHIIDAIGRIVLTTDYVGNQQQINVERFPAGIYQLQYVGQGDHAYKLQSRLVITKD